MPDPKLKYGNPSLLKINTEEDLNDERKYKTEKHDFGNISEEPLELIVNFIKEI